MSQAFDVVVIGAGIAGATVAAGLGATHKVDVYKRQGYHPAYVPWTLRIMTVTRFYLKFSLCLTSIFMLTACAVTDAQVRANPGETGSFSVQLPLKDTVENFTDRAKQCYVYGDQYANLIVNEITPDHYYNIELAQWVYACLLYTSRDQRNRG